MEESPNKTELCDEDRARGLQNSTKPTESKMPAQPLGLCYKTHTADRVGFNYI